VACHRRAGDPGGDSCATVSETRAERAALAHGLTAAIDCGAGLLAEAEDRRQRRSVQLQRVADLLQEVAVGQHQPA